jgi:DNA-nicking Smr family endonuclease
MNQHDDKALISSASADSEDAAVFLDAVKGVSPLAMPDKITHSQRLPRPIPQQKVQQAQPATIDAISDHIPLEIEAGDAWSFMCPGVSHQTLRRLRRGYWDIQARLDLHGSTRDQARRELVEFLNRSGEREYRCVQVIHGKGLSSKGHEPVLKTRVGSWLAQRDDVLAFCQAMSQDGGSGAVMVLLRGSVSKGTKA